MKPVEVRKPQHLDGLDGLVIPGGESTTIGRLAAWSGLEDLLREFAQAAPVWGTCAGLELTPDDRLHRYFVDLIQRTPRRVWAQVCTSTGQMSQRRYFGLSGSLLARFASRRAATSTR